MDIAADDIVWDNFCNGSSDLDNSYVFVPLGQAARIWLCHPIIFLQGLFENKNHRLSELIINFGGYMCNCKFRDKWRTFCNFLTNSVEKNLYQHNRMDHNWPVLRLDFLSRWWAQISTLTWFSRNANCSKERFWTFALQKIIYITKTNKLISEGVQSLSSFRRDLGICHFNLNLSNLPRRLILALLQTLQPYVCHLHPILRRYFLLSPKQSFEVYIKSWL